MGLIAFLKTQFIVHLLVGFVFVVSGLIINFLQLCTLVLWPINKELYRRVNCRLAYSLWSQLVFLLEWWSGTECTLFTEQATVDKFGTEHVIVILNHNYEIDFLCGWTICERYGVLGSSKVLAKKELLYVPLIGWTWYFLEIVFCKRKWEEDKDTVIEGLKRLADYPEYMWVSHQFIVSNGGIFFFFFMLLLDFKVSDLQCESGTGSSCQLHDLFLNFNFNFGLFFRSAFLPRSQGEEIHWKTPREQLHLTSTTFAAVYDVTLNFRGNENPTLLGTLYGKKYQADMCVRRIPLEDIPENEKECASWLHKLYQEKDALQERYEKEGTFPGQRFKPPKRPWTVLNFLFWATVLLSPLFTFAIGIFASGSPLLICGFLVFVGAASFGVRRLIGVTEIQKGSSYGNQEFKKRE
nr:PREDICTED: 1-acyl-sn-glycerol-3-phosphate acyltransferase gamma [Latimeria chalumnae]|eukprot:XP_014342017.1 PREDICTED: 1-acyl-sn-glycerol-3-phosphate acyltransferase gamma [Latimeria chalumnae]